MKLLTTFATIVAVVANLFTPALGNSLHVVIATESDAVLQRRIFMSDERVLLNFTNDDANVMIDCQTTENAGAIRAAVSLKRQPHSDDDVMNVRRSYNDKDGATFAEWKRACEQAQKRKASAISKRKVFPEMVYPGTKWCGPGDDAEDYTDLGSLINTDKCCRAHDNCPEDILPFQTKYHYFNYRPWTVTHCTCDENLFNCLKDVGFEIPEEATDSNRIGDVFFREVNPPCFRLQHNKYCVKRHWSGLWCSKWTWADDVATIRTYLAGEWNKVNNTQYIPNKPPLQPIE